MYLILFYYMFTISLFDALLYSDFITVKFRRL